MAVSLATVTTLPAQKVVTLSATNGQVTQVTLPPGVRRVRFNARTTAGKLVFGDDVAQTDGVDLGAADYFVLPAGSPFEVTFDNTGTGYANRTVFYLASATNSQVIELLLDGGE
jgi:hypothetical protein